MSSVTSGLPRQAKRQKRRTGEPRQPLSHYWSHALAMVLFVLLMWFVYSWMHQPQNMPIRNLQIQGELKQIDKNQIRLLLSNATEQGFFGIRINQLQASLEQLAWVRAADVRRLWPDKLVVHLYEQEPVAVWNNTRLLGRDGSLFTADTQSFANLIRINAPDAHKDAVIERLANWQKLLQQQDLALLQYRENGRGAIELGLSEDVQLLLGSEQQQARLQQFLDLYPQLQQSYPNGLQRIDMRYSNGLAIALKQTS